MFESITCFPLTRNCIKKGYNRFYEPINLDEEVGYCGPPDRPCIDCYICLSPICIPFDIITCFSIKKKEKSKVNIIERKNIFYVDDDSIRDQHKSFEVSEV